MSRIILAWLLLAAMLGLQVLAALAHLGWPAGVLAPLMIGVVAFLFMDVGRVSPLSRIFALAGMFWLVILIGLTSVDFLARHDYPAPVLTPP
jgi:cytochrome c oxidase subunit 4